MSKVEHVVVLMLENRSFDHVLGWLKRDDPRIEGLTGGESNPVDPKSASSASFSVTDRADWAKSLGFDPPHEFDDVTQNIFGVRQVGTSNGPGTPPTMRGFYAAALREARDRNRSEEASVVLDGYAPGRLPAIHALAREFAVCDAWFSSVPGPTWPNRFFAHCATAGGYLDGAIRSYPMPTVFGRLARAARTWKIYFHDVPQAAALDDLQRFLGNDGDYGGFARFKQFLNDAGDGNLPNYSFIEPNYWDISPANLIDGIIPGFGKDSPSRSAANDQHPPMSMRAGDELVRVVYRALRSSPAWRKAALLVVWDEHGGFYDHVAPLATRSPDNLIVQNNFRFDRLGVRVPAIVASPFVARGAVSHTAFEHASIAATLRDLFDIEPLTERDKYASSFASLLSLDVARQAPADLPDTPSALPSHDGEEDIDLGPAGRARVRRAGRPSKTEPTKLQHSLAELWQTVGGRFESRPSHKRSRPPARTTLAPAESKRRARTAVPDEVDFRDRPFAPSVAAAPPLSLVPAKGLRAPLDQGDTQACTGYALASLIDYLLVRAHRSVEGPVSPRMLYSMARRYDEWPGASADTGSSVRAALKGWFRHGACRYNLWSDEVPPEKIPSAQTKPEKDWWHDALRRPLGADYRVEKDSIADMHAALAETGVIYASANAHAGWDAGFHGSKPKGIWTIQRPPPGAGSDGGHAFIIVGYDAEGFLVQNSWGASWGTRGLARLTYDDWIANGWDAWVAQLGVPTGERIEAAGTASLRARPNDGSTGITVSGDRIVRDHEIAPFLIDAGNNGRLSETGRYRTQPDDVRALLEDQLDAFRHQPGLDPERVVDVAIYAHGGLVDQARAAATAGRWVPALYAAGVFPIFLMWETGFFEILGDFVQDVLHPGAVGLRVGDLWDRRIERFAAPLGTPVWSKIKSNAAALSRDPAGALRLLFDTTVSSRPLDPKRTRLHLIGHSAGSIVASELASWLVHREWSIDSIDFMAPAIRCDRFEQLVVPLLEKKQVRVLREYALRDSVERADPTVPLYGKSLLYLVSSAFEGGVDVPILGMEKYGHPLLSAPKIASQVDYVAAPDGRSAATTHGGFDDDETTRRDLVARLVAHPTQRKPRKRGGN